MPGDVRVEHVIALESLRKILFLDCTVLWFYVVIVLKVYGLFVLYFK
jgi:hypothetical protein